jgi:glutamine cyclotransferase
VRGSAWPFIAALVLVASAAAAQPAPETRAPTPVQTYAVVGAYPHDPAAFTQGLAFHDGLLIESTGQHPSTVRRVRLEDGAVLAQRTLPIQYFGEGLAVADDRIITLTWRHRIGFVWNLDDLSPITAFAYPGEGWGLAYDGSRLILSDGTATLRFLDPRTFVETGRITVTDQGQPVLRLNELEWIEGEVFANVWMSDRIARIDPATGHVVGWIDLTGLLPADARRPDTDVLNGIAWDAEGRRLFVTGKNWPTLFEIRLIDPD